MIRIAIGFDSDLNEWGALVIDVESDELLEHIPAASLSALLHALVDKFGA